MASKQRLLNESTDNFVGGFFTKEKSSSTTVLNTSNTTTLKLTRKPRMATLENLEAKMANIEESLSLSASRRRKGTSIGSISTKTSMKTDKMNTSSKELRSALQDRDTIMQNLRAQLGLRAVIPTGPAFDDTERAVAEQKLNRLKTEAENKKLSIQKLKSALENLEITEDHPIDVKIQQAELQYSLGKEELQLLSIVEEARAIQSRLEKSNNDNSLFSLIQNGQILTLYAVQATTGKWNASLRNGGFYIDAVDVSEELYRGDRILEVNGKILFGKSKEELQKVVANTKKCDIVVIRKKNVVNIISQQQLQQSQADNVRLQHRISYLEEQVKELLTAKEFNEKMKSSPTLREHHKVGTHVTSISISSSPNNTPSDHDEDKPTVYQRGSFITTLVNGKPLDPLPTTSAPTSKLQSVLKSASRSSLSNNQENSENGTARELLSAKSLKQLSTSLSRISINTDLYVQKREREKKERERREKSLSAKSQHAWSVELLNQQNLEKNNVLVSMNNIENSYSKRKFHKMNGSASGTETRSIKSLDFDSDIGTTNGDDKHDDYAMSEPVPAPRVRPTPPRKPIRLSLQRAQSLQAVADPNNILDSINVGDKKRAMKRLHKSDINGNDKAISSKLNGTYSRSIDFSSKYIDSNMITSSLGRQKYV